MAFTKIVSPGIDTTGSYTVRDLNAVGVVTASAFSGPLTGNATGLTGTPDITVGAITAASADFSGNVSIGGTLTYEDVTNIDSVGIVTARDAIVISEDNAIHFRGTAADDADAILRASAGGGQLLINSRNDAIINIDSNNDSTDAHFAVAHGAATGSSTELFRVQENGNVSINKTSSISAKLHIGDTSNDGALSQLVKLANDSSGPGTGAQLNLGAGNAVESTAACIGGFYDGTGTSFIVKTTGTYVNQSTVAERFRITSAGDVGIGVTNPTSFGPTLQVAGTDPALLLQDTATAVDYFGVNVASGVVNTWYDDASAFVIHTASGLSGSGLVERLRITSAGEVGIGTNNPYAKNHIEIDVNAGAGSGSAGALWLKNANQTANNSATIFFGNNVSQAAGAINFIHKDYSTNAGDITFDTRTNGSTYAERLRIKSDGKVKFATNNSTTDYLEWGGNPRLMLQAPTGLNGLRIYSDTTPLEVAGSATTRKISMGGNPNYDLSISGSYSLSSGGHDSSPKVFLNATRHNGSTTVTSFQTSIQAVSASNTAGDGYLGLGASATPDDLIIRPSGNIAIQNTGASSKLHIGDLVGSVSNDINTTHTSLIIKQTNNDNKSGFYIERSGERKGYYMWMNPGGGSGDGLTFSRNNGGSYSNALILDRDANLWGGGHFYPLSDNSYDLGSTSNRWRNVYTTDLQLSNEGSQNDVDGTWGSYTIQEGEDELFLINRRNGKKYKFNLTEVN